MGDDTTIQPPIRDPFARCEDTCNHDLALGVLVKDLLDDDGPHASMWLLPGARALVTLPGSPGRPADRTSAA